MKTSIIPFVIEALVWLEDVQLASLRVSLENYDLKKYIELFSQAQLTTTKGTLYAKYLHILGFLFYFFIFYTNLLSKI